MPLFDRYLIVDWSANNKPKSGADSIWLCFVEHGSGIVELENVSTRCAAMKIISRHIEETLASGKRLFAGFDFAFGYPTGAARVMAGEANWSAIWSSLSDLIDDDDRNSSNRFSIGGRLNTIFNDHLSETPFWGHPHKHAGRYPGLGPKRPAYKKIAEKRLVDKTMKSAQPVWKLAYPGSVGSQTLLGIPRLEKLRLEFADDLQVWPFETGFADRLNAPVILTEVYPSMLPVAGKAGEIKDAAQVRFMAETFAALDRADAFKSLLGAPPGMNPNERAVVEAEEGWMVGAGHEIPAVNLQ